MEKFGKKRENPMVSVIMSSYNHEKYVGEAIESVLNQTYTDFEFLIADDGSTDNSAEIIRKYDDERIKYWEFEENTGFETWDVMKENANGKYIAVIGSDDVWSPDKLEKQVRFLEENKDYEACFTWIETIDESSSIIEDENISRNVFFNVENKTQKEWFLHFFFVGSGLAAPSFMMKTDIYKEFDGFRFKFRQIQDYELWIRFIQKYKLSILKEKLLFYRWHVKEKKANISAPSLEGRVRTLNELHYMYGEIIENIEDDFFLNTFDEYLINPACETREEIMCEKFFVLVNHSKVEAQQCAINYYLKHIENPLFKECLESVYGFSRADFHTIETNRGIMQKMCELESVIAEYKVLLDRAITYMESKEQ